MMGLKISLPWKIVLKKGVVRIFFQDKSFSRFVQSHKIKGLGESFQFMGLNLGLSSKIA